MRTTDVTLVAAHDKAWKALKAHPLYVEIDKLFAQLGDLETWHPTSQTLAEHTARYEAGKPQEIRAKIQSLQAELFKAPENITWWNLYRRMYP